MRQPDNPNIELIEEGGEVTLYIDGVQAMQAWERELMHRSADLLCEFGDTFLEVGLGLGLSALRIANNPNIKSHTVLEKYQKVIDLFHAGRTEPVPDTLHILHADIFDYVESAPPASFDGLFFDPEFPPGMLDDRAVMDDLVPKMIRLLRPGGVFLPFFSVKPVLIDRYVRFFNKIIVHKHPFAAYDATDYLGGINRGDAYIQCFVKVD